jgi:hypothetical protein
MADRYIELIYSYQTMLQRELTIEEIQFVKWIVAKEFNHLENVSVNHTKELAFA